MALVKKSNLPGRARPSEEPPAPPASPPPARKPKHPSGKAPTAGERISAAAPELASGLAQSAAAAEELRRGMEQIAAAAEEAAGAAHESLGAISKLSATFTQARLRAEESRKRSSAVELLMGEIAAQIDASIETIQANAERQLGTVRVVASLEASAVSVGQITASVGEIAEQTNLLALNAAIEASRAGENGRGFTIVADEVRALAATSEAHAREVNSAAESVAAEVRDLVARIGNAAEIATGEAQSGRLASEQLALLRGEVAAVANGAQAILISAVEAEGAAREAQKGAESISSAAEEQSAAANQAQRAVQQQAAALEESRRASESLGERTSELASSVERLKIAQEIGTAAEELSATVQELSAAAGEIMGAIGEISRGCEIQATATQQSNAALAEIERSAELTGRNAAEAHARATTVRDNLAAVRDRIGVLTRGLIKSLEETRATVAVLNSAEESGRAMEKLVDMIAIVTVQTTMLSVSGAIEAARVGEEGRGFAVVSSDIRDLARHSASSAEQIKDIVGDLQRQIANVRAELLQIVAAGEAEMARTQVFDARLAGVERDLEGMIAGAAEISEGAGAIFAATREAADGAQQIAVAAEEASRSAQQSASAARQQAQAAEALAGLIEEIALLAEALQSAAPG